MLKDILEIAELYAAGIKKVAQRRNLWLEKHLELKQRLVEIADYLNTNASYKQGFFVDTLHAFNADFNGACAEIPSVTFRTGDMPMHVVFSNDKGEKKEYVEKGFRITFNPTISGQIAVLLFPHSSDIINKQQSFMTIDFIEDPGSLTVEAIDKIVADGMNAAFYSSYTGLENMVEKNEIQDKEKNNSNHEPAYHHDPIGFKRYETTENVQK